MAEKKEEKKEKKTVKEIPKEKKEEVKKDEKAVSKKETPATKGSPGGAEKKGEKVTEEVKKDEKKEEVKKDSKEEKKDSKDAKEEKAGEKKRPKRVKQKSRKVLVKKSKEVIAQREKVLGKKGLPTFRGRFGKRSVRKKSNPKWDKWRFPRGIDVSHEMSDGHNPREGHRTPRAIRDIHPSGFREIKIKTIVELEKVPKNHAIRVISGMGTKKKLEIVDKAIEKGIKVLNP